jgi:K+-transporting ATPase KdpF subunit
MTWVHWLAGAVAVGLLVYLTVALLKPEWFE